MAPLPKTRRQRLRTRWQLTRRLDASGTERLFTPDSAILESGGYEGVYSNYLARHLSPELKEFKSFAFSNYQISVRFEGPLAQATERYTYWIETRTGEIAEWLGVATSILKKIGGQWKILSMHNFSRRPAAQRRDPAHCFGTYGLFVEL